MFASVKLAIIIFALIALTSVVGTVIEQNTDPAKNINIIAKFVGYPSAQPVYSALDAMGFMDMYHAWWFNLLLAVFAANLTICSIEHFPPRWRLAREKLKPLKDEQFRSFSIKKEFLLRDSHNDARAMLTEAIQGIGCKKHESSEGAGGWQVYAQRQQYSRMGVYITHVSILFLLVGAVVGSLMGFNGYVNISEGENHPFAYARRNVDMIELQERNFLLDTLIRSNNDMEQAAAVLSTPEKKVTAKRLLKRLRYLGAEPLGFMVKNEDFEVSFYGQTYKAKEYSSLLVVYDQGLEVMRKRIEVNDPLKYRGYTFYQSNYGLRGNPEEFVYILDAVPAGGQPKRLEASLKEPFQIPGLGITLTIERFIHTAQFDANGRAYPDPRDSLIMANPALQVRIEKDGKSFLKWVLSRQPKTWEIMDGHRIEFVDVWGAQFTGLQVRRDPGVWIVYLGCLIMSIGLYMAFFTSHRRVWVRLRDEGRSGTKVSVAASAHKGREGFEQNIDKMITLLTEGGING